MPCSSNKCAEFLLQTKRNTFGVKLVRPFCITQQTVQPLHSTQPLAIRSAWQAEALLERCCIFGPIFSQSLIRIRRNQVLQTKDLKGRLSDSLMIQHNKTEITCFSLTFYSVVTQNGFPKKKVVRSERNADIMYIEMTQSFRENAKGQCNLGHNARNKIVF